MGLVVSCFLGGSSNRSQNLPLSSHPQKARTFGLGCPPHHRALSFPAACPPTPAKQPWRDHNLSPTYQEFPQYTNIVEYSEYETIHNCKYNAMEIQHFSNFFLCTSTSFYIIVCLQSLLTPSGINIPGCGLFVQWSHGSLQLAWCGASCANAHLVILPPLLKMVDVFLCHFCTARLATFASLALQKLDCDE